MKIDVVDTTRGNQSASGSTLARSPSPPIWIYLSNRTSGE